jgi:hypothetical protein
LTDAQVLQAAIDDPSHTTLCLPTRLRLNRAESVMVRGTIERIVGTGGILIGEGKLIVADAKPPVVKIERIGWGNLVDQTKRTVVLEAVIGHTNHASSGDLFVSDSCGTLEVNHANAHAWLWQFNAEGHNNDDLVVHGGTVRVFGWKTEAWGTKLTATGGTVEILGFEGYWGPLDKSPWLLFDVHDTKFSVAMAYQATFVNGNFHRLVRDTHGKESQEVSSADQPTGEQLSLYSNR